MKFNKLPIITALFLLSLGCSAQTFRGGGIGEIAASDRARAAHTATLLPDGRVLIAGGMQSNGVFFDEAELFDPATNAFERLDGRMTKKRVSHTATLLRDGRVLIVGGWPDRSGPERTAEVFDPKTRGFTAVGRTTFARSGHTATLLGNGKVLIAGGYDGDRTLSEAELFDPATDTFERINDMGAAHNIHTATLLADGRVLIAGGEVRVNEVVATAEIYDPRTNRFSPVAAEMNAARYKHDAVLLNDGRVLVFGGSDARDGGGKLKSAEIYDPAKGTFEPTGPMHSARFKISHTSVLLPDGRVLIAGGGERAELYDPGSDSFRVVPGSLGKALHYGTVTLLGDGRALILGGYEFVRGGGPASTDRAWIFSLRQPDAKT